MKINTYLNFPGNTEEAFTFYKSIFGGELSIVRFSDMPMAGSEIFEEDKSKIMHISLQLGNDTLMASDAPASMGYQVNFGNSYYVSVHPETKNEADRIFNALSEGGQVEMAIADQAWGDYYGSLKDKFGIQWMVNYSYPKQQ